jgi:ferredoxin-NADP reductase
VGVQPRRLLWRLAEVVEVVPETPRTKSLVLEVPGWEGHKAGQHVDVRLTAPDGYQAQRSYSMPPPRRTGGLCSQWSVWRMGRFRPTSPTC